MPGKNRRRHGEHMQTAHGKAPSCPVNSNPVPYCKLEISTPLFTSTPEYEDNEMDCGSRDKDVKVVAWRRSGKGK